MNTNRENTKLEYASDISCIERNILINYLNDIKEDEMHSIDILDSEIRVIAPMLLAESFTFKLTREFAIELILDGSESVMCKEYGDDDDWVGLTKDDLDEDNLLDDDWETLEYWSLNDEETIQVLNSMNNHHGEYLRKYLQLLK